MADRSDNRKGGKRMPPWMQEKKKKGDKDTADKKDSDFHSKAKKDQKLYKDPDADEADDMEEGKEGQEQEEQLSKGPKIGGKFKLHTIAKREMNADGSAAPGQPRHHAMHAMCKPPAHPAVHQFFGTALRLINANYPTPADCSNAANMVAGRWLGGN